ncbi:MAG: undecaprenyl-diphosphate phosphatase [Desulfobacteraceae bacterium]|nr:undecaprenyl-diphosphate phosphatase [Desulfobacteraceae bacterium]
MELYQGVVLGILQGLTEFLPVSSSGHLVLGQNFFGITEPALSFDISLHLGTLFAVVVVFFSDIKGMLLSFLRLTRAGGSTGRVRTLLKEDRDVRLGALIIVGSVPTAVLGLILKEYVHTLFSSIVIVGAMLMVTGTFLWLTKRMTGQGRGIREFGFGSALFIGFCQGLAVMPGISRSGATIAAGLFSGLDRETAARYSFLLSMPAIIGAEILSLRESFAAGGGLDSVTLLGTLAAFVSGLFALRVLLKVVRQGKIYMFAPYCWAAGLIAILSGVIL